MTTKKPRVGVYVSEEEYQALQDLAPEAKTLSQFPNQPMHQ